uniref:Uncharacterized protein n=1 Tax=Lotharella globosa TaxID=91324 RepID=A0A7S4E0R4_9EUKA|mmetsp:Transcript_1105/g.2072  ORF Transcript_1105/g.2072 Transcript_1105/m.2072 type:complete len:179 (-) Transcript_1105:269-805(-)
MPQARKPHLIVAPWKYICPKNKEWREDDRMKCEPRTDGGASRKGELLKTQLEAMESVREAMDGENKLLRDRIRFAKALTELEEDVKTLTEKNESLLRRRSQLLERMEELEKIKKKCKDLAEEKAQLETHSRNILTKIESKEHLLERYDASQMESRHDTGSEAAENGIEVREYCGDDSD